MNKMILIVLGYSILLLAACNNHQAKKPNNIYFATSAEYPPFEYIENGKIKGFDIDLANLIAEQMGKKAIFENMQFSSILPILTADRVDAAISTITVTADRKKNFVFSDPYYFETMAVVFKKTAVITDKKQLSTKKVAVQLGTTMEIWLKKHSPNTKIVTMNNNNQAIASLKAGHVDAVLIDGAQGAIFSTKTPGLAYKIIATTEDGYAIAFNKNSQLKDEINTALKILKEKGAIAALKKKWLGE